MSKYIKIVQEGKPTQIVLASNKSFFQKRGYKTEEAKKEEIEAAFPETRKQSFHEQSMSDESTKLELNEANGALAKEKSEHKETKVKLEAEKTAHESTKLELNEANGALAKAQTELENAKTEIQKLSKSK